MPFELAGFRIEREQRVRIKIVAGASDAAVGRRGISGGPESGIRFRIVGTGNPGGRAADFPRVAFPGGAAGFTRCGNGVEAPLAFTAGGIVRINESADTV